MVTMKRKTVEDLQFLTLALLIIGQCVCGANFWIGQSVYLLANVISVYRCFALNRPMADKIKDICCTGVTIGLIVFALLF